MRPLENRPPTVLIIDDEVNIRRALKRQLVRQGFEVEDTGSGREGLAWAQDRLEDA